MSFLIVELFFHLSEASQKYFFLTDFMKLDGNSLSENMNLQVITQII